jgi:hypothetical protein
MSFIQRLGSKQFPVPQKNRERMVFGKKKEIIFNEIVVVDNDGKVSLKLIGQNLDENANYEWLVNINNKTINPTIKGTVLTLSKNNSKKFKEAKKIDVQVSCNNVVKIFIIKDVKDNKESTVVDN